MVGIVLVSENREGCEMMKTARRLLGRLQGFTTVVLKPGTSDTRMATALKRAIDKVKAKGGVLLLYDMFGSTQCNVCRRFLKKGTVELITGFNLAMLVKLGSVNKIMSLKQLAPFIEQYGRTHINHLGTKRSICC
ncbi:MAG: hypothetical protein HY541_06765 [Deltaproteobacteria bacterium]|nr:hypothetical protein [Deltaproteobacteria bacterium]